MQNKILRLSFLLLSLIGLAIFIRELSGRDIVRENEEISLFKGREHFDPSLMRLKSVSEFVDYCDSLYGSKQIAAADSEKYATIISHTLRDRFYHGYSYYSMGDNTMGFILAPFIKSDLRAIVIPDDILKHPMAACSQQSIVGMEVFRKKGFPARKIEFYTDKFGGHFCYETFFNDQWHFFDPDLEPKLSIMIALHFPSITEIVKNDSLLHLLYYKQDAEMIQKLFPTFQSGSVNRFPAPRARVYQSATKILSYTSWLIFLLVYIFITKRANVTKKCAALQASLVPELRA